MHQCFYGTVPGEDAVYVISEATGGLIQKVSVPSAYGLDLSVDGTRLYVSSNVTILGYAAAQMIFVVDTASLHIVDTIRPTASVTNPSGFFFANTNNLAGSLASLSSGKLAYTATPIGVTGGAVFLNNPATGLSTYINPAGYYAGGLYKAVNGNGFVAVSGNSAGEQVSVFDTASETYTANVNFTTTNNGDVVMSPDGNSILLGGHILCNRSLQQIADLAGAGQPTSLAWTSQGSSFTPDGTKIYVASSLNTTTTSTGGGTASYSNPVVYVFNSSTHQLMNTVSLPMGSTAYQTGYKGMAVGSSGKALLVDNAGFLELDPATAPATLPAAIYETLNSGQSISPDGGTPSSPQMAAVNGVGFRTGAKVYFGQTLASTTSVTSNEIDVQPAPASPGPVDVSIAFPDGWALLATHAYSFGPVITKQSANAGGSSGGTSVTLYGNGFGGAGGNHTVTVGGRTATITASTASSITFTTPAGTAGPADLQLTTTFGSTTVSGGFTYLTQALIPSLLPNQMVMDNVRNQIYVADASSGKVFVVDATTLATTVLFTPLSGAATALAMTPDGSSLLVANAHLCTLDVVDLATGKDTRTIVPTPGGQPGTLYPTVIAATANGTALVALVDSALYDNAQLVEVNLAAGTTTVLQSNMNADVAITATPDGTSVYVAQAGDGGSGAPPELWTSASDSFTKTSVVGEFGSSDLSTTDLGDRVMDNCYSFDQLDPWLRVATVCAPDSQLTAQRDPVRGVRIHSSGSLGYLPTTQGVEILDIHHGQTVLSIGNAAGSLAGLGNLTISHDGSRLYVAQPNGIGVFTLNQVPLSIGSLTPAAGSANGGQTVTLRGSGFVQGTTVTVDGNPAGVQFADSTKLVLNMPAVTAAKHSVTVSNPGAGSYSLDAAWDASVVAAPAVPVLSSISPVSVPTGGTVTFTVNGTGFTPGAVAFLNGIAGYTQFVNTTQLVVSFSHLPGPGSDQVTVKNLPVTTPSNALSIITANSAPYLNSVTPSTIPSGSGSFLLTAFCNVSLAPNSVVLWNGTALPSQVTDLNHIVATVPASLVASAGTATITVSTPQTTPSVSNAQTFTITPSVAAMTISTSSISMGPVIAGGTASVSFTITSTGSVPLTITKLSTTSPNFSLSGCTTTLAQGSSCTATIVYTPVNNSGQQGEGGPITIASNAASQPSLVVQGVSGFLRFFPDTTSLSVHAGQSVTDSMSVTSYGYIPALAAQLSCSGLPANATCTFSPASFSMPAINGTGNGNANFTVTIKTQAPTSAFLKSSPFGTGMIAVAAVIFLFRRPRSGRSIWLTSTSILLFGFVIGCSSGGSSSGGGSGTPVLSGGTPTGTYSITVTATVAGVTPLTQVLTLQVN